MEGHYVVYCPSSKVDPGSVKTIHMENPDNPCGYALCGHSINHRWYYVGHSAFGRPLTTCRECLKVLKREAK